MTMTELVRHETATIDADQFRSVLGHFASGVTVVTTLHAGANYGTTVSSFTSLSLDPPLVLVCLDHRSALHDAIAIARTFAINILPEDGEWLSRHFASRKPDKFEGIAYTSGVQGAPLLGDAIAMVECELFEQYPGGDHSIFVGRVIAAATQGEPRPLLYYRSGYRHLD